MLVSQPWQLPPIFIHRAPMHLTGIPDERVRRVRLPDSGENASCTQFSIEQDIGGPDTGSVLWSGSLVLSAALRAHATSLGLAGASVIELGTGLGLVASVARCLGASTVLATDGDASILPFCERNLARNQGDADGAAAVAVAGELPRTCGTSRGFPRPSTRGAKLCKMAASFSAVPK